MNVNQERGLIQRKSTLSKAQNKVRIEKVLPYTQILKQKSSKAKNTKCQLTLPKRPKAKHVRLRDTTGYAFFSVYSGYGMTRRRRRTLKVLRWHHLVIDWAISYENSGLFLDSRNCSSSLDSRRSYEKRLKRRHSPSHYRAGPQWQDRR